MRKLIVVAIAAAMLAGCGEPKLDGSSQVALQESMSKVAEKLPADQREKFAADVMLLAFQGLDLGAVLSGNKSPGDVPVSMLASLNGKTAGQVSAEADKLRAERAAREREQALSEIAELTSKQALSQKAKGELSKFVVPKSRFYKQKSEYGFREEPIIEMTVQNGTDQAVSRAHFKGTISSPGRSVPWLVEDFNYSISGGMEPGESQNWALAPNAYGAWGKVTPPKDALFTVEVVQLDGADGKPLFGSGDFTERDAARLDTLQKRYAN